MPILIRNLPRTITKLQLEDMFKPFGVVLSCDLVIDNKTGQSKGFGFVELDSPSDVEKAIETLNSTVVEGVKIRVKWSNQERHLDSSNTHSDDASVDVWANINHNLDSDN